MKGFGKSDLTRQKVHENLLEREVKWNYLDMKRALNGLQ